MKISLRSLFVLFFLGGMMQAAFVSAGLSQTVQSPEAFLGYAKGERLTPHHRVMDYVMHVAENSDRVMAEPYGKSYGGRTLVLLYVSTPENLSRLEEIRTNNLRRAGLMDGQASALESKAIVWLSYNVHGNEISATEAALFTLYELATGDDTHLQNTVVIIDPLLNPDGRDRYVNWYHQTAGRLPDPYRASREHIEPWPNARTNHYNYDLNRDWAWQTQIETRQRMAVYHQWMPHIHADFHEMGVDQPYYFPPAAEPFHVAITDWQREFQQTIGENHARHFDDDFRIYFTREFFDLFYPSYGDSYPTFNGAIGMTYEQAGNTQGGLSVITAEGDTLTFARRILNQHVAGMSTVEVTSMHFERVAEEFFRFFRDAAATPFAPHKTYVISGNNSPDKLQLLTSYLDAWGISYGRAPEIRSVRALDYQSLQERNIALSSEDLLISAHQPKSVLLNVLFEPRTTIVDSLTYDITAWAVPYAMGLEAFALERRIDPAGAFSVNHPVTDFSAIPEQPYAYLARWESKQDAFYLAQLLQQNIRVRFATQPFSMDGQRTWERGTLIMTRRGNEQHGNGFDTVVRTLAEELGRELVAVNTGLVMSGRDFGSSSVPMVHAPRVALIGGPGANPNNFGEVWHFLDQELEYPHSVFEHTHLNRVNFSDFDVIILPQGGYLNQVSNQVKDDLRRWIRNGGRMITFGNSIRALDEGDQFQQLRSMPEPTDEARTAQQLLRAEDRERDAAASLITGSIYYITLDNSHPLAFGYPEFYYSLKSGSGAFEYLNNGFNVGTLHVGAHRAGFEGYRVRNHVENSLIFGVQPYGRGNIVYLNDNPIFRGFWHNGALLFANALFFVGQ